jgi:hypothetical protein
MEERNKTRSRETEFSKDMDNRKTGINPSRRRALKTIAAGSAIAGGLALGGKWTRPVVDTVILPAHAQATNATAPATTAAPTTTACNTTLASARFVTHRDQNGFYDQPVRVEGSVSPAEADKEVQVHLGLWYDGGTAYVYTDYTTTTDAAGSWAVTNTNYAGAYDAEATVTGPCGDTRHIVDDPNAVT